jgi:hypothetical protein
MRRLLGQRGCGREAHRQSHDRTYTHHGRVAQLVRARRLQRQPGSGSLNSTTSRNSHSGRSAPSIARPASSTEWHHVAPTGPNSGWISIRNRTSKLALLTYAPTASGCRPLLLLGGVFCLVTLTPGRPHKQAMPARQAAPRRRLLGTSPHQARPVVPHPAGTGSPSLQAAEQRTGPEDSAQRHPGDGQLS